MDHDEVFMRVLEYQRLKYYLEQQGAIKPDYSGVVYIIIAFLSGCIVGLFLPW